jgi:hypothetical protein
MVERFCDPRTIECLLLGLLASVKDATIASNPECVLQRHETIELIQSIIDSGAKATLGLVHKYGIMKFFARYEMLSAQQRNGHGMLLPLKDLVVRNLPNSRVEYYNVFTLYDNLTFDYGMDLEDWERKALEPVWDAIGKAGR